MLEDSALSSGAHWQKYKTVNQGNGVSKSSVQAAINVPLPKPYKFTVLQKQHEYVLRKYGVLQLAQWSSV